MKKIPNPRYLQEVVPLLKEKYPAEADSIIEDAFLRYKQIVEDNDSEPKAYHMHTRERIYPSIALFYALLGKGLTRKEAETFVCDYYALRSRKMAKLVKRLAGLPGMYKRLPSIFAKMTRKMFGEDSGFKAKYYDTPKGEMRIDMLECPYNNACIRYGCPEIVRGFCESDDICYANMHPRLKWGRTKTLGKGGDCCDFRISVIKDEKGK